MATDGPGKYKGSKRRTAKPYDRPQGIFRRVTDSVTGLFGSLSGWLGADEDGSEETGPASAAATSAPPGESFIFAQPPSTHRKPYRPIYPEEGEDVEVPSSSSSSISGAQVSTAGPTISGINLGASSSGTSSHVDSSMAPTPLTRGLHGTTSTSLGHPLPLISSTPYDQPLRTRPLMRPTPTSIDSGTESLGTDFIMPPRRVGLEEETFPSLRMPNISETNKTSSPTANALPSLEKMSSSPVNAMPSLEETQRKRLREMDTDHNSSLGGDSISNRSLFSETSRASHPQLPAASKKPRFNVSAFSTSSHLGDRSLLSDSTSRPSPFYPWRTAYGGASANKRSRYQNRLQANRAQIKPKPPPSDATAEDGGLSQAARRILDCLNNMSTPISDAKRIPTPSPGQRGSFLDSSYTATYYKHRPPSRNSGPPVTKLLTPTKSVVQPNLSKLIGGGSSGEGSSSAAEISNIVEASTATTTNKSRQQIAQAPAVSKPQENPPAPSTYPSQESSLLPKQQEQTSNVLTTTATSASIISKPTVTQVISKSTTDTSNFSFKSTSESSSAQPLFKFGESNKSTESVSSEKPLFRFGNGNNSSNSANDQDTSTSLTISSRPSIHSSELPSSINKAGGGKLKTKISDTGRASRLNEDEDDAPVPVLPSVSLTMSSLPKINFTSQQSNAVCTSTVATTGFTFSAPQPLLEPHKAAPASCDDLIVSNELEFTFSTPQNLLHEAPVVNHTPGVPMFNSISSNFQPKLKASASKSKLNAAAPLKEGSILDVLKTNSVNTSLNEETSKSTESTTITNSLAAFIKKSDEWSCDTCMVTNKSSSEKCVACETPKPGASAKEALKLSSTFTTPTPVVTNSLSAFMKKTNEWSCDTCMLTNNSSVDKCVACETPKPGSTVNNSVTSSLPITSNSNFSVPSTFNAPAGFNFKKSSEWECSECLVSNKDSAETCVCCQSAKPGTKAQQSSVFSTGLSSSKSLICDTDWKCETCLVQNIKDNKKCKECDTAKPSAVIGSQVITGNFKFGVGNTSANDSSSGGFKFGVSKSGASEAESTGFSFGVNASSTNQDSITSKTTGFSFGIKPAEVESSQATTGFKFGVNSTESITKEDKNETSGGFSFGVPQKTEQKTEVATKTEVSFGSAETNKTEDKSEVVPKPFSFGGATGGFTFGGNTNGKKDEPEKSEVEKSSVTAESKTGSEKSGFAFSFGSKPTENSVSNQNPAFQFSNNSSKDTTNTLLNSSETFSFGTAKGEEKSITSAPSFSFGAKVTESPSITFGGSALPKANDTAAAATTTTNATFTFGSAAVTKEESSSPFGGKRDRSGSDEPARKLPFGTSNTTNSGVGNSTTSLFSFGSNNTKSGGVFGAAPASNPPAFGSPAPVVTAANPTPSFSFNSTAPAPAFGAAAPSPMFGQGFGAPNNNNNNNNTSFAFGQPAEKKASTGFDFGQVANNSGTPFAFGSSEPTSSPGLFQFGQSQSSNASSGGAPMFQFGSGTPSTQTPAFGAGGGDNIFSGGAVTRSAGGQPDRRKKKAVRRIPK